MAAGQGSGDFRYVIHPGTSILIHRLASTEPDVMMPEMGRSTIHEEGVALLRRWIASLDTSKYAALAGHAPE